MIMSDDTNGNCVIKPLVCLVKKLNYFFRLLRRHEIPPFITMGKIVGSQIVRVHMTFDEMGFVYM